MFTTKKILKPFKMVIKSCYTSEKKSFLGNEKNTKGI